MWLVFPKSFWGTPTTANTTNKNEKINKSSHKLPKLQSISFWYQGILGIKGMMLSCILFLK
jgi:hypothetical protein